MYVCKERGRAQSQQTAGPQRVESREQTADSRKTERGLTLLLFAPIQSRYGDALPWVTIGRIWVCTVRFIELSKCQQHRVPPLFASMVISMLPK